jgi:ComF family protein
MTGATDGRLTESWLERVVREWLAEAGRGLLDLLYPPRCVVCREPDATRFCAACRATILPAEPSLSRGSVLAGRACVGAYEGPLREAVLRLKYHDRRALARDLGALLAGSLEEQRDSWQPDALIPVPIHPQRRRERGYNQAELLAATLGELSGLPVRDALERVRDTPPQVGRGRPDRRKNVQGAFAPRSSAAPGRRPVLIDDVQTSGATLEEAARTLRAAGAHEVFALTLCWEPLGERREPRATPRG